MHWCGQDEDYSFIVLEEFGKSFKELLEICGGKFTLKTVLMLAEEIISILQFIHFKGFCHNQINLRNLLMGVG